MKINLSSQNIIFLFAYCSLTAIIVQQTLLQVWASLEWKCNFFFLIVLFFLCTRLWSQRRLELDSGDPCLSKRALGGREVGGFISVWDRGDPPLKAALTQRCSKYVWQSIDYLRSHVQQDCVSSLLAKRHLTHKGASCVTSRWMAGKCCQITVWTMWKNTEQGTPVKGITNTSYWKSG